MKKIVCFVLAVLVITIAVMSASAVSFDSFGHTPSYYYEWEKSDIDYSSVEAASDETTADEATFDEMYVMLGDSDLDGRVTVKDATLIRKHTAGIENSQISGKRQAVTADVDANGNINIKDATAIQKHIAMIGIPYEVGKTVELGGTYKFAFKPDWSSADEISCVSFIYNGGELKAILVKELAYNAELGVYIVEIPEYTEAFVITNGYDHTGFFKIPDEQGLVLRSVGESNAF